MVSKSTPSTNDRRIGGPSPFEKKAPLSAPGESAPPASSAETLRKAFEEAGAKPLPEPSGPQTGSGTSGHQSEPETEAPEEKATDPSLETGRPLRPKSSLRIVKASQIGPLKFLVYGPSGNGKTRLAATANDDERMAPALYVDFEGGSLTIADSDIDMIRVTDFRDFNDIYEFLLHQDQYKTVILDSITEIQKLNMMMLLEQAAKMRPDRNVFRPQLDDWGMSAEMMRRLLRSFRDLPLHLVVTALPTESRDERDGTVTIKPSMPGKLADEMPAMFDIVGYLGVREVDDEDGGKRPQRILLTQPTRKFLAKDRSDRLGAGVEDPTFPRILDLIYSNR